MSAAATVRPSAPAEARMPARMPARWAGPLLVGAALAGFVATVLAFLRFPLERMPLYFAQRHLVLDATSMLFLLVVNTVFLGISVYMSSLARRSPSLAPRMPSRAALTLAFMAAMNLGVMANHLLLLWAFIELTTLCAAPLVARRGRGPGHAGWHGTTCCIRACRWR